MRILVVDNHTLHLDEIRDSLLGHDLEIQAYLPGMDFHVTDKDLVILSGGGGEGREIKDTVRRGHLWYEDQMKFIRQTDTPIIGICMGFEVICAAFGSEVQQLKQLVSGFQTLELTTSGQQRLGAKGLSQFESHSWGVSSVDGSQFEILARSGSGIEVVKHKSKPLFASQFHPEVESGGLTLRRIAESLVY